jgi:hypothetical protein
MDFAVPRLPYTRHDPTPNGSTAAMSNAAFTVAWSAIRLNGKHGPDVGASASLVARDTDDASRGTWTLRVGGAIERRVWVKVCTRTRGRECVVARDVSKELCMSNCDVNSPRLTMATTSPLVSVSAAAA